MGTLDDAIRQHLELKRRRGATEDEIARQEQEALGPARSGEVPTPLTVPEPPAGAVAAEDAVGPVGVEPGSASPAGEEAIEAEEAYGEVPGVEAVPTSAEGEDALAAEEDVLAASPAPGGGGSAGEPSAAGPASTDWLDDDPLDPFAPPAMPPAPVEPDPGAPEPEPARAEPGDAGGAAAPGAPDAPGEEPVSRAAGTEGAPSAEEDVLEETPDFLEETPEHDRLWFEQKPPKDFDFDK